MDCHALHEVQPQVGCSLSAVPIKNIADVGAPIQKHKSITFLPSIQMFTLLQKHHHVNLEFRLFSLF
jgi:hypothetical protein